MRDHWLKTAEEGKIKPRGFTIIALKQQIRRCLAAYESILDHATEENLEREQLPRFDIALDGSRLYREFDLLEATTDPFDYFMPWGIDAAVTGERYFGYVLKPVSGAKRGREDQD